MADRPRRATTLVKASLELADPEAAILQPRVAAKGSLIEALVGRPRVSTWATTEEAEAANHWLAAAAAELNEPAIAQGIASEIHELSAEWCWPDAPLVALRLNSELVALADYLPASASAHWFLRWTADTPRARPATELPIMSLAGHVPEEAEEDETMLAAVLDAAIGAATAELTGRVVDGELRDA
jgi:hypothetical protein